MIKLIHVVDDVCPEEVSSIASHVNEGAWSYLDDCGLVVEAGPTNIVTPAKSNILVNILDLGANVVLHERLVRLAPGVMGRLWEDDDGWAGIHFLAPSNSTLVGGLSFFRPVTTSNGFEWELTLIMPLKRNRLFVFSRSLGFMWSGLPQERDVRLIANTFVVSSTADFTK